jgi:hypothetical protein
MPFSEADTIDGIHRSDAAIHEVAKLVAKSIQKIEFCM